MSKQKTKRSWAKRIKVRKSGTITHWRAGKRHLLVSKSKKRKRHLTKPARLSKADARRVKGF